MLPHPAPTTPDHDYTSEDRNDDFDTVHRNHAFDNDFDLDMHRGTSTSIVILCYSITIVGEIASAPFLS